MSTASPQLGEWVDPLEMLSMTDNELLEKFGVWYIAERDPRWLRRNAVIVIGNTADHTDTEAVGILEKIAQGDDVVLAEHAQWAIDEINGRATEVPL
jgi:epoxyqueuosine reductase